MESLWTDWDMMRAEAEAAANQLLAEAAALGINTSDHTIDHICFRAKSNGEYRAVCVALEKFNCVLLIESPINGRLISTFMLPDCLWVGERSIRFIEVAEPKLCQKLQPGFEHVELVLKTGIDTWQRSYRHLFRDEDRIDKLGGINNELTVVVNSGSVKFHQLPLFGVINIERHSRLLDCLRKYEVFKKLAPWQPLPSGSIPLGVATPTSDFDLLCQAGDVAAFQENVLELFKDVEGLEVRIKNLRDGRACIAILPLVVHSTTIDLEVVAVDLPPAQQSAHRHFMVEYRLLSILPALFRQEVMRRRANGEKTEPAFASALGLEGDPYQALLELESMSDLCIWHRFKDAFVGAK